MPATCIICTEEPVATVMVACGHMCYCEACKPPTKSDCPACRVRGECIKTFVAGFDDDEPGEEPEQQPQPQPEPQPEPEQEQQQQQLPEWRVHHMAGTSDTVYHTSAPPPPQQGPPRRPVLKGDMVPWLMQPDAPRLTDYDAVDSYSYQTRHMQQGGPPMRENFFASMPSSKDVEDMFAGGGMEQMPPQMIMYRNIPAPGPAPQGPNRRARRRTGKSHGFPPAGGDPLGFVARSHGGTEVESVHMKKRDERNRTHGTCYERASASASGREDNSGVQHQLDAFYAVMADRSRTEKAQAQHEKNKRLAYETLESGYTTQDSAFVVGKQARCLMVKSTGVVQLSALRKIVEVMEHSVKLGGTRKEIVANKSQTFVKV